MPELPKIMKKLIFTILVLLLFHELLPAQSCLQEGMVFRSQRSIDNFQILYPDCVRIEGSVKIIGEDITNLRGLSAVNFIEGYLSISENPLLINLAGLENLYSISSFLEINSNYNLVSLDGLTSLNSVGGDLKINYNHSLGSLESLSSLIFIPGNLILTYNPSLLGLSGLQNITSIEGNLEIGNNESLNDVTSLLNLTSLGGTLSIYDNPELESLAGLENIKGAEANELHLRRNNSLSEDEIYEEEDADDRTIFTYEVEETGYVNLTLYDNHGKVVKVLVNELQSQGRHSIPWDNVDIAQGYYTYSLSSNSGFKYGQVLVVK